MHNPPFVPYDGEEAQIVLHEQCEHVPSDLRDVVLGVKGESCLPAGRLDGWHAFKIGVR